MDEEARKSVILVTGMHRSGTSAVTRVLGLLGCALPRVESESAPDNERGFWENPAIRDLNDRILASAGSAWDDWEPFDPRWYASPIAGEFRDGARAILEGEFADGRLFVLKDPRVCRLLPFWIDAVRSFGAEPFMVSPIRNPLDVAASLEERNGIHPSIGLLMWLRHVLDAEATSRDLKRVHLRYEHLLFETHAVVDRLGDALGLVWPTRATRTNMEIEEFLSPTLRHHKNDDTGIVGNPRLSHWLRSSFEILDRWACGSVRKKDFSVLNRVRTAFDDAAPAFGGAVAVGLRAARDLSAANDTLTEREERIESLSAGLHTSRETLAERDERIVTLTSELGAARETLLQRDARIDSLGSKLTERNARIDSLGSELTGRDERIESLSAELHTSRETLLQRDARIDTLDSELTERNARIDTLDVELTERNARIDSLGSELTGRDERIESLSAELHTSRETLLQRDARIDTLDSELTGRNARIDTLDVELTERDARIDTLGSELTERDARIESLTAKLHTSRETLAERDERIVTLTSELDTSRETLAERNARIEMLAAELGATREQLSARDERIIQLDTELRQTRASTSWRLTRPVRYLGHHARRTARLLKLTALVLRSPGSIREVMRRVHAVRRQEGATGITDRVRRVLSHDDRPAHAVLSIEDRSAEFASPSSESKPDVFIFAIIDWDFRIQRPQHLAKELAESGRRVFYFEMLLEPDGLRITRIGKNIYRVRFPSTNIGHLQPYAGSATEEQRLAWNETFNTFCDAVKATSFKQAIIQHPFWWQMLRSISPEFQLVHDCMDDVSGFSNTDRSVLDLEEDMIANCDKLIVSSQTLFDKFKASNPSCIIRNAVDADHFSSEVARHSALFKQKHPSLEMQSSSSGDSTSEVVNVGYVGAIAEWFDAALVRDAALKEPNFHFHLCGAVSDRKVTDLLQGMENVFLYGEIGYVDVPSFLGKMDVLTIPFRILPIIEACDPVKFYEYSIMGKPTVATPLPELSGASNLVFFASTPEEFATQIRRAHERIRDPEFRGALKDYALRNTWRHRGDDLVQVLEDHPLVSIIILSYGDPALSKASIHSLFEHGPTYPNMEVLVVDNGSPSASLDDIKSFASRYPNVHIVENGENLGFAKGNNVGLDRATGEYVVLLNNDTYVAPGAIHAMVRHLSGNPELGAIGPLTNNIGNEARIAVEYHDMEQMKKIARRITLGFRGRSFTVDVLGYFAVMFRRADLEHFGLLPTDYGLGMFEDDDHCRTIHSKGYVTAVAEDAFVHHHLSASFNAIEGSRRKALFERNKATFERKWGPWRPHRYRKSRPARAL